MATSIRPVSSTTWICGDRCFSRCRFRRWPSIWTSIRKSATIECINYDNEYCLKKRLYVFLKICYCFLGLRKWNTDRVFGRLGSVLQTIHARDGAMRFVVVCRAVESVWQCAWYRNANRLGTCDDCSTEQRTNETVNLLMFRFWFYWKSTTTYRLVDEMAVLELTRPPRAEPRQYAEWYELELQTHQVR